jgi:hypothetical protein
MMGRFLHHHNGPTRTQVGWPELFSAGTSHHIRFPQGRVAPRAATAMLRSHSSGHHRVVGFRATLAEPVNLNQTSESRC